MIYRFGVCVLPHHQQEELSVRAATSHQPQSCVQAFVSTYLENQRAYAKPSVSFIRKVPRQVVVMVVPADDDTMR